MRNQGIKARKFALLLLGCVAVATTAVACGVPAPQGIAPAVKEALEDPSVAAAETWPPPPVDDEGRVFIRGINKAPVVSLDSGIVADDPLVLVDGFLLNGGLAELLASEPLNIQWVGFSRDPELLPELSDRASRGMVIIGTANWQREGERAVSLDLWRRTHDEVSTFNPARQLISRLNPRFDLTRRPQPPLDLTRRRQAS